VPLEIDHVDAIARREQRDVLFIEFHPKERHELRAYEYLADGARSALIAWLDQQGYAWVPCGGFADVRVMWPYAGQIALEQPYDQSTRYGALRERLELPDGQMRDPGVRFCVMPLTYALRNAEHDEPGYWERWAEQF
jgi:hypothetical protein